MALVDIIVPTYSRAAVLPETLKSVQQQTFADWHCFIAEDGKTPETLAAVAPFLEDGRFTYLPGMHTGIPAAPRNRAIKQGSAPLIAFLDDDDLWLPEKLEMQLYFMTQHPACALVGANAYNWNTQTTADRSLPLFLPDAPTGKVSFESLSANNLIINSTAVVRRSVLPLSGLLNEALELASGEDYEFWLRIALVGEVWLMDTSLAVYHNAPQASIRKGLTLQAEYRLLACVYDSVLRGDGTACSPCACPQNRQFAIMCRNRRDYYLAKAGTFLWRSMYYRIAAKFRNFWSKLRAL